MNRALSLAEDDDMVLVTGSLFVVAEARACFMEVPADPVLEPIRPGVSV